jgi:hypothetical protein
MIFGNRYKKDLPIFEKAVEALDQDRFRKGDLVLLPAEGDIVFTGDIHGNIENLQRISESADLAGHPSRHLILHELIHNIYNEEYTADYSYECLALAAELKVQFPHQVHLFLGNHELCEYQEKAIMKNGRPIPLVFGSQGMKAMGRYGPLLKEACKKLVRRLPVGLRTASGLWFSHSTPEKHLARFNFDLLAGGPSTSGAGVGIQKADEALKAQLVEDLVWGRDYSKASAEQFAQKVKAAVLIVGHEPCRGYHVPNSYHVILDSKDRFGTYLFLRLDRRYDQKAVVASIRRLNPDVR